MDTPIINTHLRTTNIYVQKQIIRDNISRLKNHQHSKGYNLLPRAYRYKIKKLIDSQENIKTHIGKKIAFGEQTTFPFGGYLGTN